MTELELTALLDRLQDCDTPTVCNAIEVAQGKRGFSGFTHRTVQWAGGPEERIVGFARTARIAGAVPPEEPSEVIRERRMHYFRSMAEGQRPGVAVVEDIDGEAAIGAWWGELHAQAHKQVFGLQGAVTNGVMRDLGDMPSGFPILAGSVGPSHSFVHVREVGTAVEIFGMTVHQGDLIHADRHGAVCIPPDIISKLNAALDKLFTSEAIVLDPLKGGEIDFDHFERLWSQFEKART